MRSLLFLLLTCAVAHVRATVTESFVQTYPISSTGTVRLENVSGLIEIVAWDKADVHLEAVKSAPDPEDLARIHLKIESTPERLSIKTEYDKRLWIFGSWRGAVRYRLQVPATVSLEKISVINADIRVSEVKNGMFLKTVNGRITGTGLAATGRFETVNGSIHVAYVHINPATTISLRTVNGPCELTLPKDTPFNVSSKTVNGGVRTDMPIRIEKSGRSEFRGGTGKGGIEIAFKSVNGGLEINAK